MDGVHYSNVKLDIYTSAILHIIISVLIEERKGSCEDQRKHILPHSKLFTILMIELSANRVFAFKRANPIGVAGSKIVG